jgi:hypothetical protein
MAGRRIIVDILGDASKFNKATQEASTNAGKFGNILQGIGQGIGQGFVRLASRAADSVVGFVQDSVQAASDLNETITKSEVIFGKGTDAVKKWAQGAVDSMGLSERAALDAASGFAGLFKTVGISLDESTRMAQDITQLGSDLASFFNTDMDTALRALKSGLSGESEPLRQFNVFLSETAVSAKLAQMGIKKVGGQFTEEQKALARYKLIMEQTGDAQGDFLRTSDGLANSQRALDAEMENLSAELGQNLLPLLTDLTKWAKNDGIPLIRNLAKAAGIMGSAFGDANEETVKFQQHAQETGWYWQMTGQTITNVSDGLQDTFDRTGGSIDQYKGRVESALTETRRSYRITADDSHRSLQAMKNDWKSLANYLLTKFNTDFDKAMAIREARQAVTNAKTREDKVRAYADLAALGAISSAQYDDWLKTLREMSRNAKGRVKDNIDSAIADVEQLRAAAKEPVVLKFRMSYGGKALPGGDGLPGKASGGSGSGLTWVGEQGPELVNLPSGSYVNSSQKSKRIAQGSAGITVNVAGSIIGPSGVDELADMLAFRLKLDGV